MYAYLPTNLNSLRIINTYFNLSFLSNDLLAFAHHDTFCLEILIKNTQQKRTQFRFLCLLLSTSIRASPWPTGSDVLPSLVTIKGWCGEP